MKFVDEFRDPAAARNLLADDNLRVGDWVLVHVGFAMAKIDEREAAMTLDQVQKMGENYQQEIEAFNESEIA